MKIYNADKTQEINESVLDLEKGYLKADKLFIAHHKAVEAQEAVYSDRVVEEEGGGISVYKDLVSPAVEARETWDEYEDILVYIPYTAEEIEKIADEKRYKELKIELAKIKEDIEQVKVFNMVRDDYQEKILRGGKIIQELQRLEGKEPRAIRTQ